MAFVDTASGKIYGCEEGSKVWYHEKAHIKFNESELGTKIIYYGYFFQMMAVFILSISLIINWLPLKLFGLTNALGMAFCYCFEEIYAWVIGLKEYNSK